MALYADFIKEEKKETTNLGEEIKLKKFSAMLKETAVYLGERQWPHVNLSGYYTARAWRNFIRTEDIKTVDDYNKFILGYDETYFVEFICVAGGEGKSQNPYVKTLVETIFPQFAILRNCLFLRKAESVPFNSTIEATDSYGWNEEDIKRMSRNICNGWRDDIEFYRNHLEIIDKIVPELEKHAQMYSLFWNLFLTAIDDEIYNTQLSRVIDLAFMFHFDEHIVRDWCRAVEYVLNGNRLSEKCNLHCDTIEGGWFFLRDEKCLEQLAKAMRA